MPCTESLPVDILAVVDKQAVPGSRVPDEKTRYVRVAEFAPKDMYAPVPQAGVDICWDISIGQAQEAAELLRPALTIRFEVARPLKHESRT